MFRLIRYLLQFYIALINGNPNVNVLLLICRVL